MASKSIVIVDRSRSMGFALRQRLVDDIVHVFSNFRSARQLIAHKQIDAVLVEFDTDKETTSFCDEAHALGIPIIYASPQFKSLALQGYGFIASFPHLSRTPQLPVHYGRHA